MIGAMPLEIVPADVTDLHPVDARVVEHYDGPGRPMVVFTRTL